MPKPDQNQTTNNAVEEPVSAAAKAVAEDTAQNNPGADQASGATDSETVAGDTAAAKHIDSKTTEAGSDNDQATGDDSTQAQAQEVDLASMTDEDYAQAVLPDTEDGQEPIDRSLITAMAPELRALGVTPQVMAPIAKAYDAAISKVVAEQESKRKERMEQLSAECEKAIDTQTWNDFAAAYNKHVRGHERLENLIAHTELGSDVDFIKLVSLLGVPLRAEHGTPATAAAGSSKNNDLERAVFEQTVPKHLR